MHYLHVYVHTQKVRRSCDSFYQNSKIRTTELELCSTSSKTVLQ